MDKNTRKVLQRLGMYLSGVVVGDIVIMPAVRWMSRAERNQAVWRSKNVRLRWVSSGALSRSEVGGAYASGESLAERVVTACRLCLRR